MFEIVCQDKDNIEINSFEEFTEQGHSWCWCLIGNIVESHEYGEEHEIKYGTKQFSKGTKVFLAPAQWGDGYENIVVIGLPRHGDKYIEVITHSKYVENYRMQKVFKPSVLKRMCSSQYRWWGDTERDRGEIIDYLETRNLKEAERQKALLDGRGNKMVGMVLNEGGLTTYPYKVFREIEEYVKSLNWRITNAQCGGGSYVFPFEQSDDNFIDGESLFEIIKEHSDIQWWWGSLSGFPKDIPVDEIKKNMLVDLQLEQPYLKNKLHHLEPLAVFEMIAFDSTETYVLIDDMEVAKQIKQAFPDAENLEKYVYTE